MKILYAIQGSGNGHASRACYVIPEIEKYATVDILISGYQCDLTVPFDIKYKVNGLSFIFGKKGDVAIWDTIKRANIVRLIKDIRTIPVEEYDLVINDFEPVTAWACKIKNIPCLSLSHQSAVLHPLAPRPKSKDFVGEFVLKHYAPTKKAYGIHFKALDKTIYTPVIRTDIRNATISNKGHYTVYLPAFDDSLLTSLLSKIPEVTWQVFSKHAKSYSQIGNVTIFPISQEQFKESLISCEGVLCGAGFETPAEALFLGKKLIVIPMKQQYEQACNAEMLRWMGVPVLYNLTNQDMLKIKQWVLFGKIIPVKFNNNTGIMVEELLKDFQKNYAMKSVVNQKLSVL